MRYGTRSADFYRFKLKCLSEMIPFGEEAPTYEPGRE
jgi:hypothetical protein